MLALATSAFGLAKLVIQRAHPPAYVTRGGSSYHGFVAIDGYAERAERIRDALTGRDPGWARVREDVAASNHPTSFLVPVAVGALAIGGADIAHVFAGLSLAATLATALLAGAVARRLAGGVAGAAHVATALVLGHQLVVRCAGQLHMDPFCSLSVIATVLVLLEARERPRTSVDLLLLALLTGAIGIKISLLPLLAAPAAILLLDRARPARVARAVLLFAVLPLVAWWLLLRVAGRTDRLLIDFEMQASQLNFVGWRYVDVFAREMLLCFQAFPLLLLLPRPPNADPGRARVIWVVLGLMLVATAGMKLMPIPRVYLPLPPLLAALAAPRIFPLLEDRGPRVLLALHLAANVALAGIALWLSLG